MYPEYVPIFSRHDIRKGAFGDSPPHDATRWLSTLFGFSSPEYKEAYLTLISVISGDKKSSLYSPSKVGELTALILWNESSTVSKVYIAECLNETMRRLGYTEPFDLEYFVWV